MGRTHCQKKVFVLIQDFNLIPIENNSLQSWEKS